LAFEPLQGFTLGRLYFHAPLPYELQKLREKGVKTVFFASKPFKTYFYTAWNLLQSRGEVLLRGRGRRISDILLTLLLMDDAGICIRRAWLWIEKDGAAAFPCVALHVIKKGRRHRPIKPGKYIFQDGRWKRVS